MRRVGGGKEDKKKDVKGSKKALKSLETFRFRNFEPRKIQTHLQQFLLLQTHRFVRFVRAVGKEMMMSGKDI